MLNRLLKLPKKQSFFVFGARGCGKSTLLETDFSCQTTLFITLLDPQTEDRFARNPGELKAMIDAMPPEVTHVVIDEIQKQPRLLDVVHELIEKTSLYFLLTGSSARKLKYGEANLLAGRAFVYHLYPFSYLELKELFDMQQALQFGMLPRLFSFEADEERILFLQAYALTYLKEEIWAEQLTKKLDAFRKFLEVAAQSNGKIINYSNIARDVGVDDKTIKEYFSILEDTLIGYILEPFQHSFRKRLSQKPKFYYFDIGVSRALARQLSLPLLPGTSAYGDAFEHFIILECMKLANYFYTEYRFSYLRTKDDAEIDLIVERPGKPLLCIEIKSSANVSSENLQTFMRLSREISDCEAICLSNDSYAKKIEHVTVLPWREGVKKYFAAERLY